MLTENAFILAAGRGERMGPVGKILPKVVWPIFQYTLLELKILQLRKLGFKNFFINLFHEAELIRSLCIQREAFEGVTWVVESPQVLDVGGGIHHLAQKHLGYEGFLYVTSSDQFIFEEKFFQKTGKSGGHLLHGLGVTKQSKLNQILLDQDQRMIGIAPFSQIENSLHHQQEYFTFTSNSWINLSLLRPTPGVSSFWESVVDFKNKNAQVFLGKGEFWDFGTEVLYSQACQKLVKSLDPSKEQGAMVKFLRSLGELPKAELFPEFFRAELKPGHWGQLSFAHSGHQVLLKT